MRLTLPLYNAGRGTNRVSPIDSRQAPPPPVRDHTQANRLAMSAGEV